MENLFQFNTSKVISFHGNISLMRETRRVLAQQPTNRGTSSERRQVVARKVPGCPEYPHTVSHARESVQKNQTGKDKGNSLGLYRVAM